MNFQYTVRDPLGNQHEGNLEAEGLDEARMKLRSDGFQVLHIEEAEEEFSLLARRVKKGEIIYVTSQLAIMVDTGVTLSVALQSILEEEENPTLRTMLVDIKNSVEGGESLSASLQKYPRYFDTTYISLVRASEATGKLGEMLDRIAGYMRKEQETRGKVRGAMAYPMIMAVVAVCVTFFLLIYVLPKFTPLFTKKGIDLPGITLFMMTVSDSLIQRWYLWVLGIGALVGGYLYGKRTEPGQRVLDWIKLNLPILGPTFRKVIISRSIRTLGTMVGAGVSMLDAIKLSSEVAGNFYYRRLWKAVLDEVTSGNEVHVALGRSSLFPKMLVQMIKAGEENGKLDTVLARVSDHFDSEVEQSLKTATSLIEPLMIAVMGCVVGGIGMALLLPIFTLGSSAG